MDPVVSTPQLSSPKLVASSPIVESSSMKMAALPLLNEPSSSSSSSSSDIYERLTKLERELEISQARNEHLQRSLADARRSCRDAEQLLLRLQWDPKDDYYTYRNPTKANSSDAKFLDKQEQKFKSLIDQMRVMQRTIEDLQAENDDMKSKHEIDEEEEEEEDTVDAQSEKAPNGTASPAAASPFSKKQRVKSPLSSQTPASSSSWNRSPSASPLNSPNPNQANTSSPRFWLWRKLTPASSPSFWRGNSSSDISNSPAGSPAPRRLTRGGQSSSDLEIGTAPMSPAHDVASPAISAYSSKHLVNQAA